MLEEYPNETNKLVRAWIWFWYNDATRLACLFGLPVIPVVFFCHSIFGGGEYLRTVASATYIATFAWMLIDNDYSNLRRIGRDEYRKSLRSRC